MSERSKRVLQKGAQKGTKEAQWNRATRFWLNLAVRKNRNLIPSNCAFAGSIQTTAGDIHGIRRRLGTP